MTRDELLEVVYRFYPRGVPSCDPAYAASEERRRLADASRQGVVEYPTWKGMIRRLGARISVQNESNFLLAGHVDPAYSARSWLTDKRALSFHVCIIGPYYGIHHSGALDETTRASDIAREIEATYPGYQLIPSELGNEVVPDVDTDQGPFGKGTIYECLLSIVWTFVP